MYCVKTICITENIPKSVARCKDNTFSRRFIFYAINNKTAYEDALFMRQQIPLNAVIFISVDQLT